ncbi:branched-chain amino acid transport system ATP-binding protein [Cupriavidus metallidurans]|jgi:branched-chain amino acid transport system ATP-binding protein|uniref:High-affinity branched-chain amino acid transport protein of the ABC transporter, ATP binding n=1 Tax=Cupriavidus metallidurans (strain ATCC 43123 / DSM 2839 / NBRC 102507 / CH34) TaxID=266264 RepID=Q1LET2_CUPMC|nr:ABC transporter ATP-binding protein [Cupriavidus metallidurans]ABF11344.1 high-affinity branched-chain amino acid transport protein of the ABC transporter, ATP binding [Cupriavidus metallidurans CH34]KWW38498.1 High-affinity branched-chain amino acid transport ATP-binding protein LivF [Cupriavidus metallidurans]MDE4920159.1 ABC transporter ATP-binding protein [Cupriavidus metallidurans]QGS33260.1 ATP-binding cassette domain-containing protein [Cupriavidus metallidurans]
MMLDVQDIHGYYGKSHVLQGVSLAIGDGELVTLLGRNGAGKSTTLKAIAGIVPPRGGRVLFHGKDIAGMAPHRIAREGLCFVPEHRGIFKLLTVEENLKLAARKASPWQLEDVYRIFPRLRERRRNGGAQLSGGEQQMLAIGRALMNHPRLLMLDEPVEGLAPVIVEEIVAQLKVIKAAGVPILLVEQNLEVCMQLADRHVVIEQGRVVYTGGNEEFRRNDAVKDKYLGVGLTV